MIRWLAAASVGLAAWLSLGVPAVVAENGGSIVRVGLLPPLWLLPLLILTAVGAVAALKPSTRASLPLLASLILVLPWVPGNVPHAFLMWNGHLAVAVWVAIAVAVVAASKWPKPGWARSPGTAAWVAAVAACMLYLASARALSGILPGGDEPHYLIITQSLLKDGDLQIENNHTRQDYAEYFRGRLNPDYLRRGRNGQIYSIHAPGLSALIAPAYALYGYRGVVLFLSLVAAIGGALLWRAAFALTASISAAWFAWAAWAMTVPFFFQAFSVFPDGFGATVVLFAAMPMLSERPGGSAVRRATSTMRWLATGAALGLLPWLHTRFAIIAAALGFFIVLRLVSRPEGRLQLPAFLTVPVASAAAWFAFFYSIYGTLSPAAPYAGYTQTSPENILTGLPALFLDQQFGVLPNAPVYGFCAVAMIVMARRRPRLAVELSLTILVYLLSSSAYHMWWGGSSAPARFAVPVLPLLVLPGAWLWQEARQPATRALALALLVASIGITVTMVVVDGGQLAYNFRDGYSRFAEWLTPSVDLPGALPSFFRQTSGGAVLRASIWIGSLVAAWSGLKIVGPARVAAATPIALAAAFMLSATLVWRLDGVSGVTTYSSGLDLLQRFEPRIRPLGVDLTRPAALDAQEAVSRVSLSGFGRRPAPSQQTLLLVPGELPAGTYALGAAGSRAAGGVAKLVIGRGARPIESWDASKFLIDGGAKLSLPVNVGSILIDGDSDAVRDVRDLTLRPVRLLPPADRPARGYARRVERYGPGLVYFLDDGAFVEEPGFWVRGAGAARFVAVPVDRHTPLTLFVRNAAASNTIRIDIDTRSSVLELQPREERLLPIEMSDGRVAPLIRVEADAGFRPSNVEPGSTDNRYLGVWIELR